jgi:hypothetical protein
MDWLPPPVGGGHCGTPMTLFYTDRVFAAFGFDLFLSLVFKPPDPDSEEYGCKAEQNARFG